MTLPCTDSLGVKGNGNTKWICSVLFFILIFSGANTFAQNASARLDVRQITIGDQARLFLEATYNPTTERLDWAAIPDSFEKLEIVQKGKIDTIRNGERITLRQRLMVTGFDSGSFKIPPFRFAITQGNGQPYLLTTDSFELMVNNVAVDTNQAFKPIKNIIFVKAGWLDYIGQISIALLLIALAIAGTYFYLKHKKKTPPPPPPPSETLQQRTLRLLAELETKELWQKNQVKEYYVQLTEIVRGYIEQRFKTHALELTTDELLYKAQLHRELQPYLGILTTILQTADLAKFAKWQPLPQEHFDAMEQAKKFVASSATVPAATPPSPNPSTSPTGKNI